MLHSSLPASPRRARLTSLRSRIQSGRYVIDVAAVAEAFIRRSQLVAEAAKRS